MISRYGTPFSLPEVLRLFNPFSHNIGLEIFLWFRRVVRLESGNLLERSVSTESFPAPGSNQGGLYMHSEGRLTSRQRLFCQQFFSLHWCSRRVIVMNFVVVMIVIGITPPVLAEHPSSPSFGAWRQEVLNPTFPTTDFASRLAQLNEHRVLASSADIIPEEKAKGRLFAENTKDSEGNSQLENRFPGAAIKSHPTDLLDRTGGMPMEVPPELDLGRDDRERAILRRQQVLNRFNPALGLVFEPVFSYKQRVQRFNAGSGANARGNGDDAVGNTFPAGFSAGLRTIELFASADVDTFARAYLIASGHAEAISSSGSEEFLKAFFEIEEAAIQTTSLPYNLSVRGGRFFADWGYLSRRHAHDLPQIDPAPSLGQLYDVSRTDGLELSWLAPTELYLQITGGWGFNFGRIGEDPLVQRRQNVVQGNVLFGTVRSYYDITDDNNVELGVSWLYTPQSRVPEAMSAALLTVDSSTPIDRYAVDVDFHYRWYPLGRGLRQSLSVHGEILYDFGQGRRNVLGQTVSQGAWGGYVFGEYRISKRWRPGFRFDMYQLPSEPALVTNSFTGLVGSTANATGDRTTVRTWSPYVTFYPSEFQRFILQFNYSSHGNADSASMVMLQWEAVIGSHQHGFTERE